MTEENEYTKDVVVGLNIYQKLNEIRKEVAYLQKDAQVESYRAITHDMVTSALRPHLIKHGIMIIPCQTEGELCDTGKTTSRGTPLTVYKGWYTFDIVDIDDPETFFTVKMAGHGEDHGDKGPGKSISYATKVLLLKLFNIETGESDESREEQKPIPVTDEQLIVLREICESKNFPVEKTLKKLAKKIFQIDDIEKLDQRHFEKAQVFLNEQAANEATRS